MPPPTELSYDEILKFMLEHNGKVTNHELVKHFKVFLMNPDMRDEARSTFKKHVNTLAIIKNQNNEKWLILKKKYMTGNGKDEGLNESKVDLPVTDMSENLKDKDSQVPPPRPPLPLQLNQDFSILNNLIQESPQSPQATDDISLNESKESLLSFKNEDEPPKVYPRRKSTEKRASISSTTSTPKSSVPNEGFPEPTKQMSPLSTSQSESMLVASEQTISVKERKQMFNRMASEGDVPKSKPNTSFGSQLDPKSEDPLDSKQKQWILCAARGEYHALAKLCKENAKLVKTKDPFTTAMHWACKRGDENLVKLLGGLARHIVNERSGYTPLHIAMQFRHESVCRLLVEVYDADPNIRDWSGRKPRQCLVNMDTSLSPGSYRKKEGFLRIGSLNVRVKKTTEAFSNFLGVGATRASAYMPKAARDRGERRSEDLDLHKTWGSADNIQKDEKTMMLPPMSSKIRRRGASGRRGVAAAHSRSTPSTPDQARAQMGLREEGDSDSDSAAGFHSAWRHQRASHCT